MGGSTIGGLVFALLAAFAGPGQDASADDPWNGRWEIRQDTRDGQPVLVRRNMTAAALAGDRRFPVRLDVAVRLPKGADYTAASDLHDVETLLQDAIERDRKGIGVLVLTSDAKREFVFYAVDAAWATGAVAELRPKAAPLDLQDHAEPDPGWAFYTSFVP